MSTQQQEPIVDAELVDEATEVALPAVREDDHPMPADSTVLANLQTDDEWDDVDPGDLEPDAAGGWRIPYLKQNRKSGEAGSGVLMPETGEVVTTFDFIWLAKSRSRVWFEKSYGQGEKVPQCRSFDAQKADPTSPVVQNNGDCLTCPRASWGPDNPDSEHPCRDSIEALIFLPDPHGVGRLARIRWGGLAFGPAKAYWDSFFTRLPKRPPIAFVSRVTYEPEELPNGTFLVPRFEKLDEIPRTQAQPLIVERDKRLADWQADTAEDVAAGVDVDTAAAPPTGDPFADGAIAADGAAPKYEPGQEPFEEPETAAAAEPEAEISAEDAAAMAAEAAIEAAAEVEREREELGFTGAEEPDFA